MPYCAILQCKNHTRSKNLTHGGVSYHRFPRNPHMKEIWIDATGRRNWMPSKVSTICSQHFESKCFIAKKGTNRYLSETAVPTMNFFRYYDENHVKVKEEPALYSGSLQNRVMVKEDSSDSDSNDAATLPTDATDVTNVTDGNIDLLIVKEDPDSEDNAALQKNTQEEEKLKRMLRGREEVIKTQRLQINRLQAKVRRLTKRFEMVEGELKQRKLEDDQMGIIRTKYIHKDPENTSKGTDNPEAIEFVRV